MWSAIITTVGGLANTVAGGLSANKLAKTQASADAKIAEMQKQTAELQAKQAAALAGISGSNINNTNSGSNSTIIIVVIIIAVPKF